MKKVFLTILSLFSLGVLTTACTSQTTTTVNTNTTNNDKNTQINSDQGQTINTNITQAQPATGDQPVLAVSSACIGCGHCVQTDPEHFEMQGHRSIVISQDNLDSSDLEDAIDRCPAEAISL